MPTHALLGATGATGSAIIRYLLAEPPAGLKLKVLVRSKGKLFNKFPELEQKPPISIQIVEGTAENVEAIQQCVEDADVIHDCIGTNDVSPGQTIVQDSATSIIQALKNLQKIKSTSYKAPVVLLLRTTGLNDHLSRNKSWLSINVGRWGLGHSYGDLEKAHQILKTTAKESPDLLQNITVDPPTIHDQDGTERTGFKLSVDEPPTPSLSYADLGAAFCEIAERRAEFVGQAVGVSATGEVNENWPEVLGYLLKASRRRIIGF